MGKGGQRALLTNRESQIDRGTKKKVQNKITWDEVKKHITPEDSWIVFENKVYDVSNWYDHPGGAVIFTHSGDDMTDIFHAFHAAGSERMMKRFYIGDLIKESMTHKDERQFAFETGYRDLRKKLVLMGMFKSSKWFYAYKCSSILSMWVISMLMVYFSERAIIHIASALFLGLYFQQCGWLAHDFLHHQVFQKRKYGDIAGIFWGNIMQGYSVQWWKNKHNGHHAVPNLHNTSAESQDGDPDLDTMPLLAWSLYQARQQDSAACRFFIRWQCVTYFPILLLARISWLNESAKLVFNLGAVTENLKLEREKKGLQYDSLEKGGLIIHHLWMFILSTGFFRWGICYSLMYYLIATCSCGLFLALVFGLGHNGMATYSAATRPDFWKLQVTTTRNITGGHGIPQCFVDWLCGGLQYQVDHHLFPMMPRHHLPKSHALVESFCKEWGVTYHQTDLVDGTIEVLKHLSKVANEFGELYAHEFVGEFLDDGPTM